MKKYVFVTGTGLREVGVNTTVKIVFESDCRPRPWTLMSRRRSDNHGDENRYPTNRVANQQNKSP
jgi:hypothetical protein